MGEIDGRKWLKTRSPVRAPVNRDIPDDPAPLRKLYGLEK
jgi:hypothetical protein